MEQSLTVNNFHVMEPIQIQKEPNVFGSPDKPSMISFNEYLFDNVNNSIVIKRVDINEKFVTSDSLDIFDKETTNTMNISERIRETMILHDNRGVHTIIESIFETEGDFIDDKSNLNLMTTVFKSEYETIDELDINSTFCQIEEKLLRNDEICSIVNNSLQDEQYQFYHESNNPRINKRKLIDRCQSDSSQSGLSPKRRKTDEKYLFNNKDGNQSPQTKKQATLPNYATKLSHLSKLIKTNKRLLDAKVILERINVNHYLAQRNIEKLNNIKNTESDSTKELKLPFINTKKNDHLKPEDNKKYGIKTNLDKNDDYYNSLIISSCQKCNIMQKTIEKTIMQCQKCKSDMTYGCQACNYQATVYKRMIKHLKLMCKGTDYYYCNDCNYKCKRKGSIEKHILYRHLTQSQKFLECHRCKRTFKTKYIWKSHEKTCGPPLHLFCTFCPLKVKEKIQMVNHMKRHHTNQFESEKNLESIINKIVEKGHAFLADSNKTVESGTLAVACDNNIRNKTYAICRYCTKCDRTYDIKEIFTRLKKNCPECKTPFVFKCKNCESTFTKYHLIYKHIVRKCFVQNVTDMENKTLDIDANNYKLCSKCGFRFNLFKRYKNHERICLSKHSNNKDGDKNSSYRSVPLSDVKKLLKAYCSNCEKITKPIKGCKKCKQCSKTLSFRCGKCSADYCYIWNLLRHAKTHIP